jgi:UDP-glucose 4-epimerase
LYGGSGQPPYDEDSVTRPASAYGQAKAEAEAIALDLCRRRGVRVVVGRITNLFGPGQSLAKPQGLVSHLCRAHVTGSAVGIYVPLDTIRDYLFAPDCAALVLDVLDHAERVLSPGTSATKILASHRAVSVATLLREAQRVFRRPLRVLLAPSSHAEGQARDLRVRSLVWPELDRRPLETLAAGIAITAGDIETRMRLGGFGPVVA